MFTRDTFEQCCQLIELSRECLNVMFRRNADTIQGTCNTGIEYLLDFIELYFNPGLESIDVALGFNQFAVGRFKFPGNFLLPLVSITSPAFTSSWKYSLPSWPTFV